MSPEWKRLVSALTDAQNALWELEAVATPKESQTIERWLAAVEAIAREMSREEARLERVS